MTSHEKIVDFLRRAHPHEQVEVRVLPGGAFVDVRRGPGVFLTVECSVSRGIGVSRLHRDDLAFGGHDMAFASVDEALPAIDRLLRE